MARKLIDTPGTGRSLLGGSTLSETARLHAAHKATHQIVDALQKSGLTREQQLEAMNSVVDVERVFKGDGVEKEFFGDNDPVLEKLHRHSPTPTFVDAYKALSENRIGDVGHKDLLILETALRGAYKTTTDAQKMMQEAASSPYFLAQEKAKAMGDEYALSQIRLEQVKAELLRRERNFATVTGSSVDEIRQRATAALREIPTPPLDTAKNVETAAMGYPFFVSRLGTDHPDLAALLLRGDAPGREKFENLRHYQNKAIYMVSGNQEDVKVDVLEFLDEWHRCAYARLELGHRLAASLCMTDVSGIEVKMPWTAWSLVVPDGLLGDEVARIWVLDREKDDKRQVASIVMNRRGYHAGGLSAVTKEMIVSLVIGSALALSNPDEFKKERQHRPGAHAKGRKGGAPDFGQVRYMLAAPVSIDLREHVLAALDDERSGKRRGSSPKVQFLVRGHWRRQACGAGLTERRTIWIQPFWKGPEESRVLLRAHKVEDR